MIEETSEPVVGRQEISRRDTLKITAAVLALGQCLGLPAALLAETTSAGIQLKYYRSSGGEGELLHTEELAGPVLELLQNGRSKELEIKWYHGGGRQLGGYRLPAEVQLKIERQFKVVRDG